jgi:DNA-binding GntR family transcriptional regulator
MPDRPQTATRRAHAHLKAQLLDGVHPDGALLSEGAIAAELGMSRTPVREACLQLEAEGLLKLYPKRGALVVAISPREIDELFEARLLVERHALSVAEPKAIGAELERQVARQRRLTDRARYVEADRELHRTLVAAAGNSVLLDLYDRMRDRQQRAASALLAAGQTDMRSLTDEHAAIARALKKGDRATAERLLAEHLAVARERSGGSRA